MLADPPTDEVPSADALLMLPMVSGEVPLLNPAQYNVMASIDIVVLVKCAVTMKDVLYTLDTER